MPLLARRCAPCRPARRPLRWSPAAVYLSGDGRITTLDDRSDAFLRAGANVLYENPFGAGGSLQVDGEVNTRFTNLPDDNDEAFSKLRFDRI